MGGHWTSRPARVGCRSGRTPPLARDKQSVPPHLSPCQPPQVFDVLQPLIQIDKAAAHDILSKLQPGGGNPGMHALLPAIRAWLLEKRPGWLDHLMAHLFAADLGSEIARLIEGGALLVNVTAVGGTPPACFQCAHEDW